MRVHRALRGSICQGPEQHYQGTARHPRPQARCGTGRSGVSRCDMCWGSQGAPLHQQGAGARAGPRRAIPRSVVPGL